MQYRILAVTNGYLLVVYVGQKRTMYVYKMDERMAMLSHINDMMGPEVKKPS